MEHGFIVPTAASPLDAYRGRGKHSVLKAPNTVQHDVNYHNIVCVPKNDECDFCKHRPTYKGRVYPSRNDGMVFRSQYEAVVR